MLGDVAGHPAKDDRVEGCDRPPVGVAGQSVRVEQRPLAVVRAALAVRGDRQLQPGQARQSHLGAQSQQPPRFDLLDPPEVQRVADPQPRRVTPPTAQADTADQPVQPAAQRQASGKEYQPLFPPMPSTICQTADGDALTARSWTSW